MHKIYMDIFVPLTPANAVLKRVYTLLRKRINQSH